MKRYFITDRHAVGGLGNLLEVIRRALMAGVELIQIREKDLDARTLYEFSVQARALGNPLGARLLINERVDVALAAGLDGVHLPSGSIAARDIRRIAPGPFVIGVSAHSLAEIDAEADFAVVSPVFVSKSKPGYGPPLGVEQLAAIVKASPVPVYALGGVTKENAASCLAAGATGVAGISLFQETFGVDLL